MRMHWDTSYIKTVTLYHKVYTDPPCCLSLCTCTENYVVNHCTYRSDFEDELAAFEDESLVNKETVTIIIPSYCLRLLQNVMGASTHLSHQENL